MIRDQFRRFADEKGAPFAHGWHLDDALIPLPLIEELAGLGVFGLTGELWRFGAANRPCAWSRKSISTISASSLGTGRILPVG